MTSAPVKLRPHHTPVFSHGNRLDRHEVVDGSAPPLRADQGGTRHHDLPVFDKSRSQSTDPIVRSGLTGMAGMTGWAASSGVYFNRTEADRKPGKPIPFGEPDPDRFAKSEAIKAQLAAQTARYKIEGSVDRIDLRNPHNKTSKRHVSQTPDIETPRSYYVDVLPEDAKFEARRGDQVLVFMTASDAARCLTGERTPKWIKAVQNASGGVTKSAFGWTWTRLGDARNRRGSRA